MPTANIETNNYYVTVNRFHQFGQEGCAKIIVQKMKISVNAALQIVIIFIV